MSCGKSRLRVFSSSVFAKNGGQAHSERSSRIFGTAETDRDITVHATVVHSGLFFFTSGMKRSIHGCDTAERAGVRRVRMPSLKYKNALLLAEYVARVIGVLSQNVEQPTYHSIA